MMITMWAFLTFLIAVSCTHSTTTDDVTSSQPMAQTKYGTFNGHRIGECNAFIGVPFAEPPINELRFERPVPLKPSTGIRDATKWPSRCIQAAKFLKPPGIADSEDCLYLNVFVPAKKAEVAYPVMFWIHGGGFQIGSSFGYGDKGICKNLVSNDVIVVVTQYRLGLFGFLSTGDSSSPGNMGLWDQIQALKWVKENIEHFGGDKNKITIFGESAGGTSVSLLTRAHAAQEYFHQSIAQSGAATAPWSVVTNVTVGMTEKLAKSVGCHDSSGSKTLACLKKLSVDELVNASSELLPGFSLAFQWLPRKDDDLFPKSLEELETEIPGKPAIIGINSEESRMFFMPPAQFKKLVGGKSVFDERTFSLETFRNFTAPIIQPFPAKIQTLIQQLIEYVYLDSLENQKTNTTFLIEQLIRVQDDLMFYVPAYKDAIAKFNKNPAIWLYHFDYYSQQMFEPEDHFPSCMHAMELAYLFQIGHQLFNITFTANDVKIAKILGLLWTNFAKFGDPTPSGKDTDGLSWPQFAINSPKNLLINLDSHIDQYFYQARMKFWLELLPSIVGLLSN